MLKPTRDNAISCDHNRGQVFEFRGKWYRITERTEALAALLGVDSIEKIGCKLCAGKSLTGPETEMTALCWVVRNCTVSPRTYLVEVPDDEQN
jgi:hypothetical protein